MYKIYWLINVSQSKTYIGFTNNLKSRIKYHKAGRVKSTYDFYSFRCFVLEKGLTLSEAIKRERYWKSCAGRKKLKICHLRIFKALSSSG